MANFKEVVMNKYTQNCVLKEFNDQHRHILSKPQKKEVLNQIKPVPRWVNSIKNQGGIVENTNKH